MFAETMVNAGAAGPVFRLGGRSRRHGHQHADPSQVGLFRLQEAVGQVGGDVRSVDGMRRKVAEAGERLVDAPLSPQARQLVDQGVDAIIVCCSNPTALNQTVKYAYDKGVPTFSFTGYLTSPYAVNSSVNYQVAGKDLGLWLGNEIGKKGNVLVVQGIPGTSGSDSQDRGIKAGLATFPDVKIVGDVAGMWTDQVAQAEVQKWLSTNPGQLDGIVVQ
ncbi:hypothetical protein EBR16_08740, partial [bacterium]|nr:hypothetical protein [bacterium]